MAKALDMEVDFNSPLFEERVDFKNGKMFYNDDSDMYIRFKKRIDYLKKEGVTLNSSVIKDCIKMGSLLFEKNYDYEDD